MLVVLSVDSLDFAESGFNSNIVLLIIIYTPPTEDVR